MTEYIKLEQLARYLKPGDVVIWRPPYSLYRPSIDDTLDLLEKTGGQYISAGAHQDLMVRVLNSPEIIAPDNSPVWMPRVMTELMVGTFQDHVTIEEGERTYAYLHDLYITANNTLYRTLEQRATQNLFR